ncbi:hypothetical protein Hrd1104_05985 [Halorhabdus sp. CBA1104]|uniref:hypothetical protein n=1 Tax=Halorhabdus sp. CBA1104 TaxID=1380432 RepID=UPI0012B19AD3|nr:hypothetical protein [Halorhabdus sp. CBA1104]QGN06888.1 hypothetical protein Hrd1104_05985 [Halorhabdus sp. CBA1104]
MPFRDDDRAQAIQIGAVLLFAVLVIAFSLFQAFVVPNQNQQVEANHLQTVAGDMQDLRNGIISIPRTGEGRSVGIALGTSYPARLVALNPPPPGGRLHTVGTNDDTINVTVANARATDEETDDFWTGTNQTRYSGAIAYTPDYSEFIDPPTIGYDTTALFRQFDDASLWSSGQTLVDGREITLVAIEGSYDRRSSQSISLDLEALSASQTDVAVTNETGENVTIEFASMRNASDWRSLLRDSGQFTDQSGYVVSVDGTSLPEESFDLVSIAFEQSETYTLRMAKVGVGTNTESESARYITDVAGDGASIEEGSGRSLIVETRDQFNNPVSGVELSASVDAGPENGSLVNSTVVTGADGRAEFEYLADDITGQASRTVRINVSLDGQPTSAFDPQGSENVSMSVTVQNTDGSGLNTGGGNGAGAYAVDWLDPSGQAAIDCPNGPDEVCTFDAGQDLTATLAMETTPVAQDAAVEYALNDTSIVELSRATGSTNNTGNNATDVTALKDGFVNVYATSGSDGDTILLEVINTITDLVYNDDAIAVNGPDGDGTTGGVELTMTNAYGQDVIINEIKVNETSGGNIAALSDDVGSPNDEPQRTELYVEADQNSGWVDINGGVTLPYQFDLDTDGFNNDGNPRLSRGTDARIYLYEFENNGGNAVDMSGEAFTLTVYYETADGTAHTKQVRVNVP